ncbi:hypothetical protein [Aliagarivorans taiwanensis]|uniref:hypothetical protein n=1 Tax=Aliagarivorans taiwanensis TaxID=561966 RepID=UPI000421B845|nr:hypothetical protein [Aliagarivorans taiwanensis]
MNYSKVVNWPAYYHPKHASFHIKNSIVTEHKVSDIWMQLIRAHSWPSFGRRRTSVQFLTGDGEHLSKGSVFRWKTRGLEYECTVVEFIPDDRLAWRGKCGRVDLYHAWLLYPTDEGCDIVTEITQRGGLTRFTAPLLSRRFSAYHQKWLRKLHCDPNKQPAQ